MDSNTAAVLEMAIGAILILAMVFAVALCAVVRWCVQGKGLIERRPAMVDVTTHTPVARGQVVAWVAPAGAPGSSTGGV